MFSLPTRGERDSGYIVRACRLLQLGKTLGWYVTIMVGASIAVTMDKGVSEIWWEAEPPRANAGLFGPSTYEDCVLSEMKGVVSDVAAATIRQACRAKFPTKEDQRKDQERQRCEAVLKRPPSEYPSFDEWICHARLLNPDYNDAELSKYYDQQYGSSSKAMKK